VSVLNAVKRAYGVMEQRGWDTVYWAVDLHGVCLESNYKQGGYQWINQTAKETLQLISMLPESKIILWSSVHANEQYDIIKFFRDADIAVFDFNQNRFEKSNHCSNFDEKFYFSVLLDDKAGFDPKTDWAEINTYLTLQAYGRGLFNE
jgi:hypothetical protein